jgi:hypothetical protein
MQQRNTTCHLMIDHFATVSCMENLLEAGCESSFLLHSWYGGMVWIYAVTSIFRLKKPYLENHIYEGTFNPMGGCTRVYSLYAVRTFERPGQQSKSPSNFMKNEK